MCHLQSFLDFEPTQNVQTTNCKNSDPPFWSTRHFDLGHVYVASLTFFQDQTAFEAQPPPPPPGLFHPFSMRPRVKKKTLLVAAEKLLTLLEAPVTAAAAAAATKLNANQTKQQQVALHMAFPRVVNECSWSFSGGVIFHSLSNWLAADLGVTAQGHQHTPLIGH